MQKIIINNRTDLATSTVLERAMHVLNYYNANKDFAISSWSDNIYATGKQNKLSITIQIWENKNA